MSINGYPMAYVERGTGPTVLLVHGGLEDYRWWNPQLDSLSARFRVIAVSLRHYYPERWDGQGEFSATLHAKDIAAFIEHLGAGSVHLVGHSRGGLVAGTTAVTRPDLVGKLVLVEPSFFLSNPDGQSRFDRSKDLAQRLERDGPERALEYFYDTGFGPGVWFKIPEEQRQRHRDNAWTMSRPDESAVGCSDLQSLKLPVLLLGGADSNERLKSGLNATHRCIPHAKRVDIPRAGHGMSRQNPADFDAALTKFLLE